MKKGTREKRQHQLKIRMSDKEFRAAKTLAQSAGIPMAVLVRESVGKCKSWTIEDRQGLRELQGEVARVGNNLNQIARWCNTHPTSTASFEMLQVLQKIENHLEELK